jgi:thymidine kinase
MESAKLRESLYQLGGYLHLTFGPMFSGKTTWLVSIYNMCVDEKRNVVVINYAEDKRYHDTMLSTHDLVMIPCIQANTLAEIMTNPSVVSADVVLINEGQFFTDLYDTVVRLVDVDKKKVYVGGLDGDFKRTKFGGMSDLVPISDTIQKLHSSCHKCQQPAPFSHRITDEVSQIVIGSSNYIPLCRDCHLTANAAVLQSDGGLYLKRDANDIRKEYKRDLGISNIQKDHDRNE